MGFIQQFISELPIYLLSLPIVLLSLSVHECCHGYAALKLGDPTARNLGRLTLNPIKHIDLIGFICMVLFHVGWASPVPINTRYFKKPRRDMALSALAGPVSNVLLAVVFTGLLRLVLFLFLEFFPADASQTLFNAAAFLIYMLYLGVVINLGYAIFNLIPIPPLDGSRIAYVFLPPKWYFGIMRYERIIMLVMLFVLWTPPARAVLGALISGIEHAVFALFGMPQGSETYFWLVAIEQYIYSLF